MKKILAILFIIILMLTTVGCGSKNNSNDYEDSGYTEEELDELKEELEEVLIGATQSTVESAFGEARSHNGNLYCYRVPNHDFYAYVSYTFDGHNNVVYSVFFW